MARGEVLANVRKLYDVLSVGESEIQQTYYLQQANMQGQVVGGLNAFIKKVGGSIIGLDNSLRKLAEQGEVVNKFKDLKEIMEAYSNLEKLSK